MSDRILTLHPDLRKKGINIEKDKYNLIKNAILKKLSEKQEMRFMDLTKEISRELKGSFKGSINWYVTTIKLDLEARKKIERVPNEQPQALRIPKD